MQDELGPALGRRAQALVEADLGPTLRAASARAAGRPAFMGNDVLGRNSVALQSRAAVLLEFMEMPFFKILILLRKSSVAPAAARATGPVIRAIVSLIEHCDMLPLLTVSPVLGNLARGEGAQAPKAACA